MVRITWPSLPIRMKAFGAKSPGAAAWLRPNGRFKLNTSPPPRAAALVRKPRRDRLVSSEREAMRSVIISASLCVRLRGKLDRFANAYIGPAAADIPAHGVINIGIRGIRITGKQRRRRHDLSGLTVAALHNFMFKPGLLDSCAR